MRPNRLIPKGNYQPKAKARYDSVLSLTGSRGRRLSFPIRSCIACRKRENWNDLLRLVVIDNQVHPDPDHKKPGRGAWMHRKCFDVATQRKALERAFKSSTDLHKEVLENYLKLLKEQ